MVQETKNQPSTVAAPRTEATPRGPPPRCAGSVELQRTHRWLQAATLAAMGVAIFLYRTQVLGGA